MQKKLQRFVIKGMKRDLDISKSTPEYSYENRNIRITTDKDNSLLTITNERGTKLTTEFEIKGFTLGTCVLNEEAIIFSTTNTNSVNSGNCNNPTDYIYKYNFNSNNFTTLYKGNLNFINTNPIETIGLYETNDIKKVYWVDGRNETRVLNIEDSKLSKEDTCTILPKDYFNFSTELKLLENFNISKIPSSDGLFPSGVIQYAFNYYNLYGKQSPIIEVSPLLYMTHYNRGASPEETTNNSFRISISDVDTNYEYIRLYSIQRSSINDVPNVYKIADIKIEGSSSIEYIDNNKNIESIDFNLLYYLGGEELIPSTFEHKDNTLFLGNIKQAKPILPKEIEEEIANITINEVRGESIIYNEEYAFSDKFQLNLSQSEITTFKKGEFYRLGIQFQDSKGRYSNPIWIKDHEVLSKFYSTSLTNNEYITTNFSITLPESLKSKLKSLGYKKARPIIIYPNNNEKTVICQGIINPTVYNIEDRKTNSPYVQQSWFIRPDAPTNDLLLEDDKSYLPKLTAEYRHLHSLPINNSPNAEMANNQYDDDSLIDYSNYNSWHPRKNRYEVDRSILSLITPELLNEDINNISQLDNTYLSIVGIVPITSNVKKYDITTKVLNSSNKSIEFKELPSPSKLDIEYFKSINSLSREAYKTLLAVPIWLGRDGTNGLGGNYFSYIPNRFVVFPFHQIGSLEETLEDKTKENAILDTKKLLNYKYSKTSLYFNNTTDIDLFSATVVRDNNMVNTGIRINDKYVFYRNTIDKISIGAGFKGNTIIEEFNKRMYYSRGTWYNDIPNIPVTLEEVNNPKIAEHIYSSDLPFGFNKQNVNTELKYYASTDNKHYKTNSPVSIKYKGNKHIVVALKDTYLGYNNDKHDLGFSKVIDSRYILYYTNETLLVRNMTHISSSVNESTDNTNLILKYTSNFNQEVDLAIVKNYIEDCTLKAKLYKKYNYTVEAAISKDTNSTNYNITISVIFNPKVDINIIEENKEYYSIFLNTELSSYTNERDRKLFLGNPDNIITQHTPTNIKETIPEMEEYGYVYLAELRRKDINNRFGGTNKSNLHLLDWLIAGKAVDLDSNVLYTNGDTYYQRYEHINSSAYSDKDVNQIYDGISFMVETRVNLNGRYDKNKTITDLTNTTYENFNKLNPIYNQENNFFKYKYIDPKLYSNFVYPTRVILSKQKHLGEHIDTWTNITGVSSLDLDGDKGVLTKLVRHNNEILFFQENGVGQIMFNSRVQIPTSDGVPIEITNSLKVEGKRYLSEYIGCQNKWSICKSPNGIYFIDNFSNTFYNLNQQILPISELKGFRDFFTLSYKDKIYYPDTKFNNFILYYDEANRDVYIVGKDTLVFSESLNEFESFFDYSLLQGMFNIKNKLFSIKDNKLWFNREGEYLNFYNSNYPFSIEYLSNPDGHLDKIFTNIEVRGDSFKDGLLGDSDIEFIQASNEYQNSTIRLNKRVNSISNKKNKYRIWRANIPRPSITRRIRNPWIKLKLISGITNKRNTINDVIITYYV